MYHQINPTETFRERQHALLGEAENRRLARRRLRTKRILKARSAIALLGFLAALVVASIMLVGFSSPAHAETTFAVNSELDTPDTNVGDGSCSTDRLIGQSPECTLRAAIQEANATNAADVINFNIPGSGVKTISPNALLPVITEPVTINGYTQPGASPNTLAKGTNAKLLIELNGTTLGAGGGGGGLNIQASNVTVKGLVINSFVDKDGIFISPRTPGDVATNIRIEGNFLGTDPSGTIDRGNGDTGVFIFSGTSNTVGGSSPDKRNLISGNDFGGVYIQGDATFGASSNNVVEGNLVGTQKDGVTALGNGSSDGVEVSAFSSADTGNRILSNSIFSNGDLGIDLGDNGLTANDVGDEDTGANNLQNFPVLTSARTSRKGTTIKGTLNSRPGAVYTIQFFSNPPGTDEGAKFIGQRSVSVDASGDASFAFKPKKVGVGQAITATATNEFTGDTSEFSTPTAVRRAR